jgi:predicted amidophosphoribosyltransferase
VAVVSYEYPWRGIVAGLKYQSDLALAPWMATLALGRPEVQEVLAQADWLLPMPLSLPRLGERGYNQAYEWARHLAPDKLARDCVLRLPTSLPQAGLDKAERLAQVEVLRLAFVPHPDHVVKLRGKSVLLVDDVQTTGTTLHALAQVLLAAGVREVNALVFARAEVA